MAFIPEEDEGSQEPGMNTLAAEDQQQTQQTQSAQEQEQQIGGGASTMIGAGQTPIGSQSGQAPVSTGTRKRKGSGMFTDIRKYISANKPASQRLSEKVVGGIEKQAQDIRNQIQKQEDKFQQSLAQNQANLQQTRNFAQEAVQQAGTGQLTEQDFGRFQDIVSGKARFDVAEPTGLMSERPRARALERLASRAGSAAGREELLKKTFGQGRLYTRGQRAIDSLILGADPSKTNQLAQEARTRFGTLPSELQEARKKAIQDVYGLKRDVSQFTGREGEAAQSVLGEQGAKTVLAQQLDQAAQERLNQLTTRREELLSKLQKRSFLTNEEMDELGVPENLRGTFQAFLTATSGAPKEVDFSSYLGQVDPKMFTRANIATPEQLARFNALSQLVGEQGLQEQQQLGLDFNTQAAIQDVLGRMNRGGVEVRDEGLFGSLTDLGGLEEALLLANPFLATSILSTKALKDAGEQALGTLNIDPFSLTNNMIMSNDMVLKSTDQLMNLLGAGSLTKGSDVSKVIGALATGGLSEAQNVATQAVSAAKKAAEAAARAISSIFCYAAGAPVLMADGQYKNIEDLDIDDVTHLGGPVTATGKAKALCPIWEYKGRLVTGSHAVFEDEEWVRVEESKHGKITDVSEETIVYPVNTENHIMVVDDHIVADFQETDDSWELDEDEKIDFLNNDVDKNNWLLEEQKKLQGGSNGNSKV